MAEDSKVLTAHVPIELAEQVDLFASRLDRSRGWVVKQALTAWVALQEERYKMTLEGLADIDAGHVHSQDEMEDWLDSLRADNTSKPGM